VVMVTMAETATEMATITATTMTPMLMMAH
jgi:hypothetical protein